MMEWLGMCFMRTFLVAVFVLLMITPANAQTWQIDYTVRGDVSQLTQFYGTGAYLFLKTPTTDIPVYLQSSGWQFQGLYGQVALPESLPKIAFTGSYDQAVASQVGGSAVPVPELALLRLPRHIYGRELGALLNPPLQRITAWGATGLLRAIGLPAVHRGIYVDLSSATLEVQEWCSGLVSAKWFLLLGLIIVVIGRRRHRSPWSLALLVVAAAPIIAIEANILRVAGMGATIEWVGIEARHGAAKEWLGWAALALGVGQIVGLGWLAARPAKGGTS